MATYEYQCRVCDTVFEEQRSMTAVATAVECPQGHRDVKRRFSSCAVGASTAGGTATTMPTGGGCCGGACGCGH